MSREARGDLLSGSVLLLVYLAVWLPRLQGPINFRWDASVYYILGTAVAEGKGYRLLNEPGEIHAVQYPPLLPMIIAAHQWILRTNDYFKVGSALRITSFMLSGVFLLAAYTLARKLLSPLYALFVGVITALSFSSLIEPSDVLYAEMPFAVATMCFLLCQQRSDRQAFGAAAGVFGVAAYLLRTAGIALLLAWIAESLIRRRFGQAALRAAISALPVLLWQGYVWRVTASVEYHHPRYAYQRADYYYPNVTYGQNSRLADPFRPELGHMQVRDLAGRLARNIAALPEALAESAVVPQSLVTAVFARVRQNLGARLQGDWSALVSGVSYGGLFAAGLLALTGAVLMAIGPHWFLSLVFGINLGLIVMTPWQNQFWRYLAPIAPLTLIFLIVAIGAIRLWLERRHLKYGRAVGVIGTIALATAMLIVQSASAVHVFRSRGPVSYYDAAGGERVLKLYDYGSEWHALDPAFEWIRCNTTATSVIATTVPHLAYLRTGHKAVLPPFEPDPNVASRLLEEVPVNYLVLDTFGLPGISERYAAPVVAQRSQDWRLVFTAPGAKARVYERTR